ncbi:RelA/SpoT domain-containing protein [Alteriqipengyuania lutimaris]|uniref:RelA/SpoT domain-containing protein n=1 Tax=Alteriqipengyuania lutimaris TaxID=1538146 RepID=A0A395LH43_9SPHN|nr:RelA/SpoT domain-containing protein [Alteriqipengyuania lutimaris]MBB3035331.1 ppGpp synthetase/RelA/SpoT-type nucleotidyltransferase [Alteriqipengyuania lutimaris]RDS75919.1 hypothetical protein DL238_14675 [Alteriqipengyuania lutimaris]
MASIDTLYASITSRIDAVHNIVNPALSDFTAGNEFLLTSRKKRLPSLYEKLFTARYANISEVDDLLAYTIVIDLPSQSQIVERYLKRAFSVETIRGPQTLFDERFFDFDSTRVICRLGASGDDSHILNSILFEVQIKTLLQYAWSKITHPIVYKPEKYDAQKSRLAAETLARLEAVDRTFQNFEKISPTVKTVRRREMVGADKIAAMFRSLHEDGTIPSELKPESGRRVSECVFSAIRSDKQRDLDTIIPQMREFIARLNPIPRSISLFELGIVFLHEKNYLYLGSKRRPRYYYISDELKSLFPEMKAFAHAMSLEPQP